MWLLNRTAYLLVNISLKLRMRVKPSTTILRAPFESWTAIFSMFNVCYVPRLKWRPWTSGFAMRNLHSVTTRLASIYERTTRIRMPGSTCSPRIARWWVTQGHALFYAFRALHTCALLSDTNLIPEIFIKKDFVENLKEILELWIFLFEQIFANLLGCKKKY